MEIYQVKHIEPPLVGDEPSEYSLGLFAHLDRAIFVAKEYLQSFPEKHLKAGIECGTNIFVDLDGNNIEPIHAGIIIKKLSVLE